MELVESVDMEDIVITSTDKLKADKIFCSNLIDTFLIDNRDFPLAFTPEISLGLMQKFAPIKALCEVGDIKIVKALMSGVVTDSVFTQERKEKYLQMINNYLI